MKPVVILITFLVLLASSALAGQYGSVEEWYLYPSLQYFTWKEYTDGRRLVKEEGPLFGVGGGVVGGLYRKTLMLKANGELFGSEVDYHGHTQQGSDPKVSERPLSTKVVYFGMKLEGDIGWRMQPATTWFVEPFAGIGYRWWLRALESSTATDTDGKPFPVGGYTEVWQTLYSRVGLRGNSEVSTDFNLFCEAGGKYPFLNRNSADNPGTGTVTLRPDPRWSLFAEVGARYGKFRPALFYEGFRFGQSPAVPVGGGLALLQPKSDSDLFGIRFGWAF